MQINFSLYDDETRKRRSDLVEEKKKKKKLMLYRLAGSGNDQSIFYNVKRVL